MGGVLALVAVVSYAATRVALRSARGTAVTPPAFAVLQDFLGVTSDQRSALASIDAHYGAVRPALRNRVWQARDELIGVLEDPKSTRGQALDKARRFCAAQEALQVNTVEYMFELRRHLNPAQRAKLAGLVGRGMCALTGGPCPRGMGRGMGLGPGGGSCGGRGWRGGRP